MQVKAPKKLVPPAGLEPTLSAPEANTLSTELWGHNTFSLTGFIPSKRRLLYTVKIKRIAMLQTY